MNELEKLFLFAEKNGITKRQIGIVMCGKNWRNIYKAKNQWSVIERRNKKIEDSIRKLIEAKNI